MNPIKGIYRNEDALIDEFCDRSKCRDCFNDSSNSNSSGCAPCDEFVEENIGLILENAEEVHEYYEKLLEEGLLKLSLLDAKISNLYAFFYHRETRKPQYDDDFNGIA
ncbi:MAG: hypothetical protein KAX49_20640 [Halanaerobiales bacterium]|nr:hypothetical protein [Halanaerobiales bacterium]